VWQVILGWSHDDEAWHLGLLLARDLAEARGSRWCQLAIWPDPDTTVFKELAEETGQALSRVVNRPLNIIPPRQRQAPPLPLPELPREIGQWKLEKTSEDQLQLVLSRQWVISRLTRAAWYTFWIVVYLVLSITTLTTNLALPNAGTLLPSPELLPYLGLASAAVLGLMTLYIFYDILTHPNRIIVGGAEKSVMALHGKRPRWQMTRGDVESIYVTQVVNKKGRKRTIYHGEINLHTDNGSFHRVLRQGQQDSELYERAQDDITRQEMLQQLSPNGVISDLQSLGLHISKLLDDLPVWYDQRLR